MINYNEVLIKYLPVEGRIDTTSERHLFFDENGNLQRMNRFFALHFNEKWKRAKLFVCIEIDEEIKNQINELQRSV